jgi:hypothetical protein
MLSHDNEQLPEQEGEEMAKLSGTISTATHAKRPAPAALSAKR